MLKQTDLDTFHCFLDETIESFEIIESNIIKLDTNIDYNSFIEEIFRAIHGIKGNAGFFNINNMRSVAHKLEDLLQDIRSGRLEINNEIIDYLIEGIDILKNIVNVIRKNNNNVILTEKEKSYIEKVDNCRNLKSLEYDITQEINSLMDMFSELKQNNIDPNTLPYAPYFLESTKQFTKNIQIILNKSNGKQAENALYTISDKDITGDVNILNEVIYQLKNKKQISKQLANNFIISFYSIYNELARNNYKIEMIDKAKIFIEFIDDYRINNNDEYIDEINQVIENVIKSINKNDYYNRGIKNNIHTEHTKNNGYNKNNRESDIISDLNKSSINSKNIKTIRVHQDKIDEFAFQVGELTMGLETLECVQKMIEQNNQTVNEFKDLKDITVALSEISNVLEKSVMEIRKIPAKTVMQKMPVLVRMLSKSVGKYIDTEIIGEEELVDKDILEKISDPMVHLIRNSVDHGIEKDPNDRKAKGKDERGKITISANSDNKYFYLNIIDDGQGIDPEQIRNVARNKRLYNEDKINRMNDDDIISMIFNNGFSSAIEISEISGRGVGLDVVRKNIEDLSGSINVKSNKGYGTTFGIKIPLTTTLLTKEVFIVEEDKNIYAIPTKSVDRVISICQNDIKKHKNLMIANIQNKVYTLIRLGDYLRNSKQNTIKSQSVSGLLLKKQNIGIIVDKTNDFSKVVVNNSDNGLLKNIPILEGFTIRGDGKIVALIDIDYLLRNVIK